MTFDAIVNENAKENVNANANASGDDALGVKVSFGNEIRRATFNGTVYAALELVTKLFEIDQASAVLKYQDNDGDKVTVSSDGELQDAIQLVKADKKALRLFVEARPTVVQAEVSSAEQLSSPSVGVRNPRWNHGPFPGPFHHGRGDYRGPFGHHGRHSPHFGPASENPAQPTPLEPASAGHSKPPFVHTHPHFGAHPHPHPPFGAHPHPHPPFGAKPHPHPPFGHEGHDHPHYSVQEGYVTGLPPFHCPFDPADAPRSHHFGAPSVFAHGTFSPAECPATTSEREARSPYSAGCAFKEHKRAMKEAIRAMKANASTPEDVQAIQELKEKMRSECRGRWKGCHIGEQSSDRLIAKHVADVTIPDNSELLADTPVTKTWRLKNAGTTAWPVDSQLVFVSRRGDNLNGPERVGVQGPVLPQQEVDVSVTFVTPSEPGRYIGYYRMATSDGTKFGQRVWVSFIIPPNPSAPKAGTAVAEPPTATAGDKALD